MRGDKKRKTQIAVFFSGALFILLSLAVILESTLVKQYNLFISSFFSGARTPIGTELMFVITRAADDTTLIFLTLSLSVVFLALNRKKDALMMLFAVVGTELFVKIAKSITGQTRPLDGILYITENAFPSGHAAAGLVFYALFFSLIKPSLKGKLFSHYSGGAVSLLIVLIGLSRLYLGVHWATDVLGGYLLGMFCLGICALVFKHAL